MSPRIVGGTVPDPAHIERARRVLAAAMRDDYRAASRALVDVFVAGPQALSTLLYAAADTFVAAQEAHRGPIPDAVEVVAPIWLDAQTGSIGGADTVPAAVRWAGRFAAARAAADQAQCEALLRVLQNLDADEVVGHVGALVDVCVNAVHIARGRCVCGRCRS